MDDSRATLSVTRRNKNHECRNPYPMYRLVVEGIRFRD